MNELKAHAKRLVSPYNERNFKSNFGLPLKVVSVVWEYIKSHTLIADPSYLLITLYFYKLYPTERQFSSIWSKPTKSLASIVQLTTKFMNENLPEVCLLINIVEL